MDLLVEVWEVMRDRPYGDLFCIAVRAPVAVGAVSIALLQEALVLALELVVEEDPPEASTALGDALRGALVGSKDLDVVSELPRLPDAGVERLASTLAGAPPVLVQEVTSLPRQRDHVVPPAAQAGGLDKAGFPEMPQVAAARVQCLTVVIAEIARADYAEGADGCQRATLGAAKLVGAVAERDLLALALLGRPSTAPVAIVAFPVTVSRIVERIVSVEHRRCPSRERRRA